MNKTITIPNWPTATFMPLTGGMYTLVDNDTYERYKDSSARWVAHKSPHDTFYARRTRVKRINGKKRNTNELLHRLILGLQKGDGLQVDHINGNPLDNRRANLRVCSSKENSRNKTKQVGAYSSKYKGVSYHKRNKKWGASIRCDGTIKFLGLFESEADAARAYNAAALNLHGDFAKLNEVQS